MNWQRDQHMTEWARTVFQDATLIVKRHGSQYLLEGTPYGRVEIVSLGPKGDFLVAAQAPPREMPESGISGEIRRHLRRHDLKPWKYEIGTTVSQILFGLRDPERAPPPCDKDTWPPFALPMSCDVPVIGEERRQTVPRVAALASMAGAHRLLAVLEGPAKVGRHTIAASAARKMGLRPLELALSRFLVPRVMQTPCEVLMDVFSTCRSHLTGGDLLVLSEGELLRKIPPSCLPYLPYVLNELSSLPHILLVSGEGDNTATPNGVRVRVIGLTERQDIEQLLCSARPGSGGPLVGAPFDMICRAASVPGFGVLPGRLLHLTELAYLLREPPAAGREVTLTPDDVAAAISLASQVWQRAPSRTEQDI